MGNCYDICRKESKRLEKEEIPRLDRCHIFLLRALKIFVLMLLTLIPGALSFETHLHLWSWKVLRNILCFLIASSLATQSDSYSANIQKK